MASLSPSESNNPDRLTLSEDDAAVNIKSGANTWAVTEQSLTEGSGSFSFELLDDRKDDEATCFGVVSESKLSSFPKDVHTSSGSNVSGIAYLRSYNGKVAHSGGSNEDSSCKFHVGDTLRMEVDLDEGTCEFYVNDKKHRETAKGLSGPVRGFFFSYASSKDCKARVTAVPAPPAAAVEPSSEPTPLSAPDITRAPNLTGAPLEPLCSTDRRKGHSVDERTGSGLSYVTEITSRPPGGCQ